jgi:hypothetical protein
MFAAGINHSLRRSGAGAGSLKFSLDENIGCRCRDILTKAGQRCARHDPSLTINTSAVISKFPNKSKPAYPHFF